MKKSNFYIVFYFLIIGALFPQQTIAQTVYVTKTGSKFHKGNCRYLHSSKITISLSDAKAKGYTACKVCKPSSSVSPTIKGQDTATVKASTKATQKTEPATTTISSKRCSAITQKGTQCKRMTKSPNGKCWQHGGD